MDRAKALKMSSSVFKFVGECISRTCIHLIDDLAVLHIKRTEGMYERPESGVYGLSKSTQVLSVSRFVRFVSRFA